MPLKAGKTNCHLFIACQIPGTTLSPIIDSSALPSYGIINILHKSSAWKRGQPGSWQVPCLAVFSPFDHVTALGCCCDTDYVCRSSDRGCASTDVSTHCKSPCQNGNINSLCGCQTVNNRIMVAANGILSINALATADTQIIMAIITFRLPPLTLPINPARW